MVEAVTYYPVIIYPAEPSDDHYFAILKSLDGKVTEVARGILPQILAENFVSAMGKDGNFLYIPPTTSLTIDEIAGEPPKCYTVKHMKPKQIQEFKRELMRH